MAVANHARHALIDIAGQTSLKEAIALIPAATSLSLTILG